MKKSHLPTSLINRVITWLAVSLVIASIALGQVTNSVVWAASESQTKSASVVSTNPVNDEAAPQEISVEPVEVEVKAQPSAWQRLLKSTGIRANYQGIKAEIRNSEGEKVEDVVSDDSNSADQFLFHLDPAKLELAPGEYQLVVEYAGEVIYQDFTYGVLAVNATKDVYTLGEAASLELAALDSHGTTLCNANLLLTITTPDGGQTNPEVVKSGECDGNNVTDVPDYSAEYVPELEGEYRLKLQNLDQNFVIESSFQVVADPELSIERLGPSRIYPMANYLMNINVYSKNGFSGTVSESVPSSFAIESDGASKSQQGELTIISWPVEIAPGETAELAYLFDAPDVSPQFYSLGSIQLLDNKNPIYTESRQWQVASDDTSTKAIGSESGTNWSASGGCTFGTNCVTTSNNQYATFNGTGRNTLYLKNIGFSIPAGSTIDGIVIGFEGYGSGTTAARRTIRLNVTKNGTNATDATWNTQAFTTRDASYTTGTSTDLWGTTWTVSEINSTNFGVMISDNDTTARALYIDHVQITVYYTPPVTINVSGSTNVASGTVKWAKNGVAQAETATIGSGTWSLTATGLAQNDIVTTWIDAAAETDESTAITKYDGTGDITGMVLNANVLSVGSVDNPSLVLSNFAYTNTNNENVMHSYGSSTLTVDGGNSYSTEKLDVLSGATLTVGISEIVNTHHLSINGTLTSGGSSTYNVYGNWENNATFTASTSTVDFKLASGTQTLKSGGTGAGKLFNNLTHSGAGTLQLNTNAIDVDGNFAQTAGTFDANSFSQNFAGDFSLSSGTVFTKGGTTTFDGSVAKAITDNTTGQQDLGAVVIDGTSKSISSSTNIKLTTLSIGADDTLDISSDTLAILGSGTPFTKTGAFTTTGSTVVYAGTTATNVTTTAYNNLTFTPASGTPTYTLQASLTAGNAIAGNLTISSGATLSTSASNFNLEVKGNWANAGSFTSGTNTVTFSATATGKTIVTGGTGTGQDFNHVVFNSSSGGWTIQTNDMKVAGNLTITDVNDWTLQTGRILEVNGQYTITGNETAATTWTGSTLYLNNGTSTSYTINSIKTASAETYGTLQIGANTDVRMWNSTATTFTVDATGSLYSQNHANTAGSLYIWGDYNVVGTDYWSYATDFDSVALGGSSRQANVRIDPAGGVTVGSGKTLNAIGTSSFRTTVDRQGASNGYGLTIAGGTINFNYVNFDRLDGNKGLDIQTGSTVTSLDYTKYDNLVGTAGTDDAFITLSTSIVGTGTKILTGLQFDNTGTGAEFNVNLSGTAVTGYWDFESSSGTFDGESYDGASGMAEADPGTLRWDDSAQPPLAPTDLLAEGATNPTGVIDLTPEMSAIYRDNNVGDTANKYQIQVDDNSDFTSVFWDSGASGTSMTNCTVNNRCQDISYTGSVLTRGITYYWRIKYWDIAGLEGDFSSESATFKLNQLPNTPTNTAPTDGLGNQSLTPTLQSSAFSDSDVGDTHSASQWQVSTASGAGFDAGIVWDSGTDTTNKTSRVVGTTLSTGTTYYWRVRHQDDKTEWSSYSTITSFTTYYPPSAPTDLLAEGATNPTGIIDLTPELSAIYRDSDAGDTANKYQIQVDDNSDFTSVFWDSGASGTSMTNCTVNNRCQDISYSGSALTRGTTYYWRIKFWDVGGAEGAFSSVTATFKINQIPNTPTNTSPTNGAGNQSLTPTLQSSAFSDSDVGDTHAASQWQVSTATGAGFDAGIVWDSGTDTTNKTSRVVGTTLSTGTIYYWRVRHQDNRTEWSSYSTITSFTTSYPPNTPTNTSPTNGAINQSLTPTLQSSAFSDPDAGATHAASQWQVSTASGAGFDAAIVWDSGTDTTNKTSRVVGTTLNPGVTYYWRVRHRDDRSVWSSYSVITSFTTYYAPSAPTDLLAEGATNPNGLIDLTPELSAIYRDSDAGDTANKYRIQVDDNSDFSSVFWDTGVSGTSMTNCTVNTRCQDISYSGSALTRGTVYYWRIKFWDVGGAEGVFSSESATFKLNQLPNTPTNTSPTNGGTEQSQNPTLQSSAFSDSDVGDTHSNSQWQVSTATGAGFDAAIVWDSGVTATNKTSVVVNSTNGTFQGSLSGQTQLALNSTYYWRVRHQDDKTEWSSYSTITSFTTIVSNPPTAPTIPWCEGQTNPTNVTSATPSFSAIHNDPDGDAANFYQIEVNTNSSFSGTVMWNSTKTSMSNLASGVRSADFVYAGSGLQLSTTYYWRIRFWDVNGYEGAVSATQQFTTASFVSGNFFFEGLQMEGLNIN